MQIQLSEDLAIEIEAIAAVAGCPASAVLTAILRRGYAAIENEARHLRAIEQWDSGRAGLQKHGHEPLPKHWRCALDLEESL